MVHNQIVSNAFSSDSKSNELLAGLQGMVQHIPAGFTHSTLLYAGRGVTRTVKQWGEVLLRKYNKRPTPPFADVGIQYLGYYTDNGGFYWYNTEKGKNYERTMADVATYINDIGLPVQYYQLDSWWYYKGVNDGLKLWEPMPSVFPNGMEAVSGSFGFKPLILHNRYFSTNNDYEGQFTFINEGDFALPIDQKLFEYIMGKARQWGLHVYEQDWLITTYLNMRATQNNVTNANNWLLAMGNAARAQGLTIQYCMPLPIHLMASVQIQAVTHARASDDYKTTAGNHQWQVAYTSLFHWAVGLVPFKDDFWSSSGNQSGCAYSWGCYEPNPEMQTLVAALTSGPVSPSDGIGHLNSTRLMQTCRQDGLLLKADKPATPLESLWASQFATMSNTHLEQIWESETRIGEFAWHYLFSANLSSAYTVHSTEFADDTSNNQSFLAYDYYRQTVAYFDERHPLVLPKGLQDKATRVFPFTYHTIAPVLANGWTFLGERNKFITVSKQRVMEVNVVSAGKQDSSDNYLSVTVSGVPGELLELSFVGPTSSGTPRISVVKCAIESITATATVTCVSGNNVCTCVA
eukprot:TRINITY_DN845_c0_g2_i6.p1 TRINITY_DN845_c0_g2~~TRINITY_DN845_c0_g2_i6.p1  ORF type:complete len:576 (+),score=72.90 TRINITY_DN845_c0_g2_i6:149-1876(+)